MDSLFSISAVSSFMAVAAGITVALYFIAVAMVRLVPSPKSAQDMLRTTKLLTIVMGILVFAVSSVGLVVLTLAIIRIVGASESLLQNPIWQFSIFLHFVAVVACVAVTMTAGPPSTWRPAASPVGFKRKRNTLWLDRSFKSMKSSGIFRELYVFTFRTEVTAREASILKGAVTPLKPASPSTRKFIRKLTQLSSTGFRSTL